MKRDLPLIILGFIAGAALTGILLLETTAISHIRSLETKIYSLQLQVNELQSRLERAQAGLKQNNRRAEGKIGQDGSIKTKDNLIAAKGSKGIFFFRFLISSGPEPIQISEIRIRRYGVSTDDSLADIELYYGDKKLASRSIQPATHKAAFDNLELTIPASTLAVFTVRSGISEKAKTGDTVQLGIDSHRDLIADPPIVGNFPLKGNNIIVASNSALVN